MWYYLESYWLYLIIVGPTLLFAIGAQIKVNNNFKKYSRVLSSRRLTGAMAAQEVLNFYGITDVVIERVGGRLSDHYDPKSKVIRLSDGVYNSCSVAAIGVACHEAGHAAQHAENYAPIKLRNSILPVCNIGSYLGIPLAFLGFFMGFGILVDIGLILYSFIAVFQLVTLPVEFNASRRAVAVINQTNILSDSELVGTKKVLSAAAMTYVAALATSLANLLRFIILFGRGKRD
ncbi:MAG: zinc metallopeptidase [Ruminococcaceae bacterium]|nr:zinc metallopeptidase [Oscillospiraceae bacterium]